MLFLRFCKIDSASDSSSPYRFPPAVYSERPSWSHRIQSFPDEWEFVGSVSSQYKQIGNAVPVKLAEAVGKQIIKALNGETSKKEVQSKLF